MKYWINVEKDEEGVVLRYKGDDEREYEMMVDAVYEIFEYDDVYHGDDGDL